MNNSLYAVLMPPVVGETGEDDASRFARYKRYLDFFNGRQWEQRPKPGERRLTVNYARAFVLKMASYLLGRGVRCEVLPGDGYDNEAAQAFLDGVWASNRLDLLDFDTAVDSATLGDGGWKITLQPLDNNAEAAGPVIESGGMRWQVSVRNCDVMGLTARWQGDDTRRLLEVSERYQLTVQEAEQVTGDGYQVTGVGVITQNSKFMRPSYEGKTQNSSVTRHLRPDTLLPVIETWSKERWKLEVAGKIVRDEPNPYGIIPYVLFPNTRRPRQFWGESDLVDVLGLNSELNSRVSVLSQILQLSGNPILVLENVEQESNLRVGPGAIWALPENSRAYLLDLLKEGGLGLHLEYIEMLYRMLHDLTEMPRSSFGENGSTSAKSGVALELELQPLVQKVFRKRMVWSDALERRNALILRLGGFGPNVRTRIVWGELLPKDRSAAVRDEVALVEAGIHTAETALHQLGDFDQHDNYQ